jgi:hypothetical protein
MLRKCPLPSKQTCTVTAAAVCAALTCAHWLPAAPAELHEGNLTRLHVLVQQRIRQHVIDHVCDGLQEKRGGGVRAAAAAAAADHVSTCLCSTASGSTSSIMCMMVCRGRAEGGTAQQGQQMHQHPHLMSQLPAGCILRQICLCGFTMSSIDTLYPKCTLTVHTHSRKQTRVTSTATQHTHLSQWPHAILQASPSWIMRSSRRGPTASSMPKHIPYSHQNHGKT